MSTQRELIVKSKNLSVSNITYKPPTVNKRGGKSIKCMYNGNPLRIQFPFIFTWGVNENEDENTGNVKYDVALQFGDKLDEHFKVKLKEFQEKILDDAVSNSKQWFGRKMSKEVAEAMMYPILKYPKLKDGSGELNYDKEPNFRVKLPCYDNVFSVEIFDTKGKCLFNPKMEEDAPQGDLTPKDIIESRSKIKGIIECNGIWMAGGRFGVTWKLLQTAVRPPVNIIGSGTCHLMSDSDDDEEERKLEKEEKLKNAIQNQEEKVENECVSVMDDSDDDQEQEKVVEEKVEEVKPKKKKRVVRRKKKTAA